MIEKTEEFAKKLFEETSKKLDTVNFWIAGGAIRAFVEAPGLESLSDGKSVAMSKDVDCFFNDPNDMEKAKKSLLDQGYRIGKTRKSSYVMEKEGEVEYDLVFNDFAYSGKSIFSDFDFTNCCVAYGKEGLSFGDTFFDDVQKRKLNINRLKLPYHTIQRAGKFMKNGYDLSIVDKLVIFEEAANAPWGPYDEEEYNNPEEIEGKSDFSPSIDDIPF